MKLKYLIIIILFITSCSFNTTDVYQTNRNNLINIQDKINVIDFETSIFSRYSMISTTKDYLIVADNDSPDTVMQIFDKNSFNHIKSFGIKGQGPFEYISIGPIKYDELDNSILITEFAKKEIYSYNLDSLLEISNYILNVKYKLLPIFPSYYYQINDSISLCELIQIDENSCIKSIAKWHMKNNFYEYYDDKDSKIENSSISLAVSRSNKIFAKCYENLDLIRLYDFEGNLLKNIYGPNRNEHDFVNYNLSLFTKDYLFALFIGERIEKNINITKIQVFDINGNYLATLDLKYKIRDFCYDEYTNRLFIFFDDEIQFGYINIDELML
ncbi:MAG: TolB-like 6-bladed beta-propeller domain-containing protein [Bacteroidales bacterium]|nr:TolB-like 6-bladed beta-propeller domain-containing protein [Bacteroidales bacterium]